MLVSGVGQILCPGKQAACASARLVRPLNVSLDRDSTCSRMYWEMLADRQLGTISRHHTKAMCASHQGLSKRAPDAGLNVVILAMSTPKASQAQIMTSPHV